MFVQDGVIDLVKLAGRRCSVRGCGGRHEGKGLCNKHLKQIHRKEYTKKYLQREDVKERKKLWDKENKQKIKDKNRRWYLRNKETVAKKIKERSKEKRREISRKSLYKRKYKITLEEYSSMLEKQNHVCAICYLPEKIKNSLLCIDHHHSTGKIRGLLCRSCNIGIGNLKDNIQLLENAIKYLKESE